MTGKYSTQTGDTIISLDADLATMMGMMQSLMECFERQDASNKAINERVDDLAAAIDNPVPMNKILTLQGDNCSKKRQSNRS
ncbi:unnamed protein product [Brassica oleracea var. botrytis]|uniref:(rape) hypothetical protein n=1 Tax=Brassica napus TaxID=3708 RepID=A0A078IC08_BRANA|nr:unnamed protein product [Brassica napus]CDY47366.1 BnaCnng15030D [Brassica napus]